MLQKVYDFITSRAKNATILGRYQASGRQLGELDELDATAS
jgi:hypothetical protein